MHRAFLRGMTFLLFLAAPLWSQQRPASPAASPLREQIEQRFATRVQEELRLNDEQAARLRTTAAEYGKRRHDLRDRARALRQALADQLQPGIAANQDSVARLIDALIDLRFRYSENLRSELKELSEFLDPVQRARLLVMRERLLRAAGKARARRFDPTF